MKLTDTMTVMEIIDSGNISIIKELDQNSLGELMGHSNEMVRVQVARHVDQTDVHFMMNDLSYMVREVVAQRVVYSDKLFMMTYDENRYVRASAFSTALEYLKTNYERHTPQQLISQYWKIEEQFAEKEKSVTKKASYITVPSTGEKVELLPWPQAKQVDLNNDSLNTLSIGANPTKEDRELWANKYAGKCEIKALKHYIRESYPYLTLRQVDIEAAQAIITSHAITCSSSVGDPGVTDPPGISSTGIVGSGTFNYSKTAWPIVGSGPPVQVAGATGFQGTGPMSPQGSPGPRPIWVTGPNNWAVSWSGDEKIAVEKTEMKVSGPISCSSCNMINEYAEPNQSNGTYICYNCK